MKLLEFKELPIEALHIDPDHPRNSTEPEPVRRRLERSVARFGILTPISVIAIDDGYMIIDGNRRYRAAKDVGLQRVPCFVHQVRDRGELEWLRFELQQSSRRGARHANELGLSPYGLVLEDVVASLEDAKAALEAEQLATNEELEDIEETIARLRKRRHAA